MISFDLLDLLLRTDEAVRKVSRWTNERCLSEATNSLYLSFLVLWFRILKAHFFITVYTQV